MIFLKSELGNISTVSALMNDFDKNFVLAFYNYYLKIELHCDKESMVS